MSRNTTHQTQQVHVVPDIIPLRNLFIELKHFYTVRLKAIQDQSETNSELGKD